MPGTDIAYTAALYYALCGTEPGDAMRCQAMLVQSPVLRQARDRTRKCASSQISSTWSPTPLLSATPCPGMVLHPYAMRRTDLGYAATLSSALSGTDLGYGPTRYGAGPQGLCSGAPPFVAEMLLFMGRLCCCLGCHGAVYGGSAAVYLGTAAINGVAADVNGCTTAISGINAAISGRHDDAKHVVTPLGATRLLRGVP
eukprot:3941342-Rhodomonas_salina.3